MNVFRGADNFQSPIHQYKEAAQGHNRPSISPTITPGASTFCGSTRYFPSGKTFESQFADQVESKSRVSGRADSLRPLKYAPTATATSTRRIRWPRSCRGGGMRPQYGICSWRTRRSPAPSPWSPRRCTADRAAATGPAEVIEPRTRGNPYETLDLLNALRRDGVLIATAGGWRWDEAAVRANLGRSEVAGLSAARVAAMPARST
jgi:hypothetical protein